MSKQSHPMNWLNLLFRRGCQRNERAKQSSNNPGANTHSISTKSATETTSPIMANAVHAPPSLITIVTLAAVVMSMLVSRVSSSGMVEFEFTHLEQLDVSGQHANGSRTNNPSIKLTICLKEAFASHLGQPCAYGNSTITLARHQHNSPFNQTQSDNASTRHNNKRQPILSNLVRIPFTFRWMKSFTLIVTVENQQTTANPSSVITTRHTPSNRLNVNIFNQQVNQSSQHATISVHSYSIKQTNTTDPNSMPERYVFTENEVLPIQDQSSGSINSWTERTQRSSRNFKSSLNYRFRIYCSPHYYGDDCATFCRDRSDNFGHYNCSPAGQKICHEGWKGADCDIAKCRQDCNEMHGFCDTPNTCSCRPGWTGPRCDQCIPYPGCKNGYCLSPWQCLCNKNWGGILCDGDLNYCGTHEPCLNNASCQNVAPDRYKCNCLPGYTGENCGVKDTACATNPCQNGGHCVLKRNRTNVNEVFNQTVDTIIRQQSKKTHLEPSFICSCPSGLTGQFCEVAIISSPIYPVINATTTTATATTTTMETKSSNRSSCAEEIPCSANSNELLKCQVSFFKYYSEIIRDRGTMFRWITILALINIVAGLIFITLISPRERALEARLISIIGDVRNSYNWPLVGNPTLPKDDPPEYSPPQISIDDMLETKYDATKKYHSSNKTTKPGWPCPVHDVEKQDYTTTLNSKLVDEPPLFVKKGQGEIWI